MRRARVLTLADFPPWFLRVFAVLMGLLWGSFLNVVIYRVPRGMSVVRPGSTCPSCGAPIKPWDNVPLLAYLWLRGRTRCCKTRLSPRYPLIEAMIGLLMWAVVEVVLLRLHPSTPAWQVLVVYVVDLLFALGLVGAAFIDLEHVYIPEFIPYGLSALGVLSFWTRPPLSIREVVVGAFVGFLIVWLPFDFLYRKLRGRTGMALGDAMLVMTAGAWFGIEGAFFALMAGAVQGTLAAGLIWLVKGKLDDHESVAKERAELEAAIAALSPEERAELEASGQDPILDEPEGGLGARIPFGPFLALAMLEYLLIGRDVMQAVFGVGE